MDDSLAGRLRAVRGARGMRVAELARRAGISRDHVYRLERGERAHVGGDIVARLADALETTSDYLLGVTDDWRLPVVDPAPLPDLDLARFVERLNGVSDRDRGWVLSALGAVLDLYDGMRGGAAVIDLEAFDRLCAGLSSSDLVRLEVRLRSLLVADSDVDAQALG